MISFTRICVLGSSACSGLNCTCMYPQDVNCIATSRSLQRYIRTLHCCTMTSWHSSSQRSTQEWTVNLLATSSYYQIFMHMQCNMATSRHAYTRVQCSPASVARPNLMGGLDNIAGPPYIRMYTAGRRNLCHNLSTIYLIPHLVP